MDSLFKDIRYALRGLSKRKRFTAVTVLTLALGIGVSTAIFSVVNGVLLRPLPYQNSDRLAMIWGNFEKLELHRLSAKVAEYEDYRAQSQTFEQVAGFENQDLNLTGADQPERLTGARITANLFPMLGAQPAQGRSFQANENQIGRDKVVVISHGFWLRHFAGSDDVLGQILRFDNEDYQVIGVMPAGFQFPHENFPFGQPADIWLPLSYSREQVTQRQGPYRLQVLALLKNGVSLDAARTELNVLGQRFETSYSGYRGPNGEDGGWRITLVSVHEEVVGKSRRVLWLLLGAVLLVLLIACANVANLLLVGASLRKQELAVRAALGATRLRLARQLLLESLSLAFMGGGLGFIVALWGVTSLGQLQTPNLPRLKEVTVDGRVFAFTFLLTMLTALISGVIPAWQASMVDLQSALKREASSFGSWRRHHWRNLLLISEVALAFVLLVGAGLLVKSFLQLQANRPAISSDKLLLADINLPASRYAEPEQSAQFFRELVQNVQGLPGVVAATVSNIRPLSGTARNDPFSIEGRRLDPANLSFAGWQSVGANYFSTLGIPLVQGRDFAPQDMSVDAPVVAVINEAMARRYWPNENPIGRRITLGLPRSDNPWITIIGISKNLPHRAIDSGPEPDWYLSRASSPQRNQILFVRTAGEPTQLAAPIRTVVTAIDPNQPVGHISTLEEVIAETVAPRRFNLILFGLFAGLAIVLAALGVYGVISHSVAERTHELGIRMALGAQRSSVLVLVVRKGMMITLIGLVVGLAISLAVAQLMSTLLFDVKPYDITTFATVAVFVSLVALVACYVPALRAAKIDPLVAIRHE